MSKRLSMLVGVVALASFATSCGGGEDDEGSTKAQYVKEANALCTSTAKEIGAEFTAYLKDRQLTENGTATQADLEKALGEVVLSGFRSQVAELEELAVPEGDEPEVEAMFAKFDAGLEDGEENPGDLFGSPDSQFAQARGLAESYGLKTCGTLSL